VRHELTTEERRRGAYAAAAAKRRKKEAIQRRVIELRAQAIVNRRNNWSPPVYESDEVALARIRHEEQEAILRAYAERER
jgi:hypothetical protein